MKAKQFKSLRSVGIWIRVSTEDQAQGDSPAHHEARARAYAQSKGWDVREVYNLAGVSGKSVAEHPEAKRMLGDIKSGRIKALIFSKLARLARNTRELLQFSDTFKAHGADLVSLEDSIDTSTPAGLMFYTVQAALSQWEREEIASRVKASVPIRAKLGKPLSGQVPFGYMRKDGKVVPNPDEAPVRKLMYELFAETRRKKAVARLLNERGYKSPGGKAWTYTTVNRLLRDTTAKGQYRQNYTTTNDRTKQWEYKPESEWVVTPVDAIVKEELWEECNRVLAERRISHKKPSRENVQLFSGFAFCDCGGKMYVASNSPKYICPKCRNKIPIGDLEAVYRDELSRFLIAPEAVTAHLEAAHGQIQETEALVSAAERELRTLADEDERVYRLYIADKLSQDDFGRRHGPLATRRDQLEAELPRLQAKVDVMKISVASKQEAASDSGNLIARWTEFSPAQRRQLVETITDRIVVGKEEVAVNLLYFPASLTSDAKATETQGFIAATSWKRAG